MWGRGGKYINPAARPTKFHAKRRFSVAIAASFCYNRHSKTEKDGNSAMITTELYENENHDLAAIVYEDGICTNYIPDALMAALDGDSFLEEARLGFPEAILYDDDFQFAGNTEFDPAVQQEKRDSVLIAEIGEEILLYPHRMSEQQREFFAMELGEDVMEDALARAVGDEGVVVDL